MRQMINSMATKMEIGSPMASMYVLGNPDHYKSHQYGNFAWRPFTVFVKRFRPTVYSTLTLFEWVQSAEKKAHSHKSKKVFDPDNDIVQKMTKKAKHYKCTQHDFLPVHTAAYKSHTVHCDFRNFDIVVPNFLNDTLPRADKGDREFIA
ncbi:hypothetical protein K438DRAFT_2117524 [Mycena galopus ATCC 62051]|nr:hypothetical protein K438DRAFT_2117524 [Mycena galopus ATCC 62051]